MLLNEQHAAAALLVDAIAQKYTINGEMFSAEYLYKLTRKHFRDEDECLFYKGILNCVNIKEHLIAGKCLLVPYPFQNIIILITNLNSIIVLVISMGSTGAACRAFSYLVFFSAKSESSKQNINIRFIYFIFIVK